MSNFFGKKNFIIKNLKAKFIIEILVSTLIIIFCLYIVNRFYGEIGGVENNNSMLILEFPLIIMFYLSLLSILKNSLFNYLIAGLPFVLFYIVFNEFYLYYNRTLRFSDFYQIPELIKFSKFWQVGIGFLIVALFTYFFIKNLNKKKLRKPFILLAILLITFYSIKFEPNTFLKLNMSLGFQENTQKQKINAQNRGILNYMLFVEAKKNKAIKDLKNSPIDNVTKDLNLKTNLKNIHFIVLESFYDPNMFSNLSFSKNPLYPEFERKYADIHNYSRSPVYAGLTPQAEFELLTGVPAYQDYSTIEFNMFTGEKVDGFVNNLKKLGYKTIAMNAVSPEIFNSYNAYKSIGFEDQFYLYGKKYSETKKSYELMFDGEVFKKNLKVLDSIKNIHPSTPVFNYVLGIYGHTPFPMNDSIHPKIIDIEFEREKVGDYESRTINQIYYRTKALYNYLNELIERDPKSIIVVVGDHMPFIKDIEDYGYQDKYKIRFYILKDGKSVQIEKVVNHYELPNLIIKLISGEEIIFTDEELKSKYKRMFFQSLN